jgi:hypothetical protein
MAALAEEGLGMQIRQVVQARRDRTAAREHKVAMTPVEAVVEILRQVLML